MKLLNRLLLILILCLISSCGSYEWNYDFDWYAGDSQKESIIGESREGVERIVSCNEPRFDEFACLHRTKILELANEIDEMKISTSKKRKLKSIIGM